MSHRLMTPADFIRWSLNLDVSTWREFSLAVFSFLVVSEKITAFWKRNAAGWPMRKANTIEIRSMVGAALENLLSWEEMTDWRRKNPEKIARIKKWFDQDKWKTLLDVLPLPDWVKE